jgi:predicted ATPase/transcriptional regulator with XRE-family HTH domain
MVNEISFGEWLKHQRRGRGLTQKQLADQIGCATITLRKIESGERFPSVQNVKKVAEIFNVSPAEQKVFLRFARGDWRSVPTQIKEDAPWQVSTKSPRSNLPAPTSSLVGREGAIADIRNYLLRTDIRLVTLVGPPGIGKTRLSIEAARTVLSTFPDGVFFVALAPVNDPSLIALTIIQALGYVDATDIPARQQLTDGIGGKPMLILLDNCEHLIEDIASLASDLLSACSQLKLLATSREALRVRGEWIYPVPALDVPTESWSIHISSALKFPALTLFAERARAVSPDFTLNAENIRAVSSICARVDGLPLAIELMAARMRLMSPQALLDRLSGQFIMTADGMRSPTERQKTLNHAIRWSYNLLSSEEQKLFAYLSVFSGGFALDVAEAMFSPTLSGKSLSNLVASLLDKSLLQRALEREEHGEARYMMLVTIQQFARERLLELGEATEIRNRHLTYFCKLAEQASPQLRGAGQLAWLDRLDAEYDNIRAALTWAQESGAINEGLQLATDLEFFWIWRAHLQEPLLTLENLLAQPLPAEQTQALARGHRLAWRLHSILGNRIPAQTHAQEDERLSLLLGPEGNVDRAEAKLRSIGWIAAKEPIQVVQKFDKVFEVLQEISDPSLTAQWYKRMGDALANSGDFVGARRALEQSLKLCRERGDSIGLFYPNQSLAIIALREGNYTKASAQLEELLHFCRQARLNIWIDIPLWLLGVIAIREGDYARAKAWYTECLLFDRQIGLQRQLAECLIGFSGIAHAERCLERGAQLLGAAETEMEASGPSSLEDFDQEEFDHLTAVLREELGDARFEALVSQGRAMRMAQAVEYALGRTCYS